MKTLVIGATGTVGSHVVQGLRARGHQVRALTRSDEKAERLPDGVEPVVGDAFDPDALDAAFDGVDALFFVTPLHPDEMRMGLNIVEAAERADADRVVYMSVHRLDEGLEVPNFRAKKPVEGAIIASGLPFTILRASSFFQNDRFYRDAILEHGVYPEPFGDVGVHRIDVRDIADAAILALTEEGHNGEIYNLAGPELLTGHVIAQHYSDRLGREVRYAGDDLDAWAERMGPRMPSWLVDDLRAMYAHLQRHGLGTNDREQSRLVHLLGRAPRSYAAFVDEMARAWQAEPAGTA